MREAHARAREVLEARSDQMDQMAAVLLARETVEGPELDALLNGTWDAYVAEHPEAAIDEAKTDGAAEAADDAKKDLPDDETLIAEAAAAAAARTEADEASEACTEAETPVEAETTADPATAEPESAASVLPEEKNEE